jgi:secreted trypsin-like serine protease
MFRQVPAAALASALAGQDPEAFVIASDGCGGRVLAAGASCEIRLAFQPSAMRQFSAELIVSSGKVEARVHISGTGDTGATLSFAGVFSFGGVTVGTSAPNVVIVSNLWHRASPPLAFTATGDGDSFSVAGNCVHEALAPGQPASSK